jgi:hypothetical protein
MTFTLSGRESAESWTWTSAYLVFAATCLATTFFADPVSIHITFIGSMLALSFLGFVAPLTWKASLTRGGRAHDLVRRASVMPVFYLVWRYLNETGVLARYLPAG